MHNSVAGKTDNLLLHLLNEGAGGRT